MKLVVFDELAPVDDELMPKEKKSLTFLANSEDFHYLCTQKIKG